MNSQRKPTPQAGNGPKVLIGLPERIFSEILATKFRLKGIEASQAYDGLETWKAAKENDFDIILLDLNLPYISGMELLERFTGDENISGKTVILSMFSDLDLSKKAMELGAADFIKKPLNLDVLMSRCDQLLTNNTQTNIYHA